MDSSWLCEDGALDFVSNGSRAVVACRTSYVDPPVRVTVEKNAIDHNMNASLADEFLQLTCDERDPAEQRRSEYPDVGGRWSKYLRPSQGPSIRRIEATHTWIRRFFSTDCRAKLRSALGGVEMRGNGSSLVCEEY
jgi:hypothetical protein